MPTKITRAERRAKKVQVRNARRTAAGKRRAYRLVARYERRIEATNTRIADAIKRQKVLIAEWRDAHRNALAEIREGMLDVEEGDGRERPDDAVAADLGGDQGGGGEGRVLPDPSEPGGVGSGSGASNGSDGDSGVTSVVGY